MVFLPFWRINTSAITPGWFDIPKYLYIMNSHDMYYHLMTKPKNQWNIPCTPSTRRHVNSHFSKFIYTQFKSVSFKNLPQVVQIMQYVHGLHSVNDRTEPKIGVSVFSVRFGSFRSGSVRSGNTEPKQTFSNRSEKVP